MRIILNWKFKIIVYGMLRFIHFVFSGLSSTQEVKVPVGRAAALQFSITKGRGTTGAVQQSKKVQQEVQR